MFEPLVSFRSIARFGPTGSVARRLRRGTHHRARARIRQLQGHGPDSCPNKPVRLDKFGSRVAGADQG